MNESREQWALRVLSGEDRGIGASLLRGGLAIAEPFYAGAMVARNALYDAGIFRSHALPRPTISVGNLTTGGTGKTPVVRWLAEQLAERGLKPAILMRGYRADQTGGSDEQRMLIEYLGERAAVVTNSDRVAGALLALSSDPHVFILDDAFQHRRVRREFNLLLINAANPFGYGHVLPRGLLREPVRGMKRADAILVTHDDPANPLPIDASVPVLRCAHVHMSLRRVGMPDMPINMLAREPFFGFAGIANASSFREQLARHGGTFAGFRAFRDHHAYNEGDLAVLRDEAARAGATMLVTTEKDWVKVAALPSALAGLPIVRTQLQLSFAGDHEPRLLELVLSKVTAARPASSSSEHQASAAPGAAKAS